MDLFGIGFDLFLNRLLASGPRIDRRGNELILKSRVMPQILCLGFGSRRVVLNSAQKVLHLEKRSFWLFHSSRRVEFEWVAEVVYGYKDITLDPCASFDAHREEDLFTVGLRLKNGQDVTLFRFAGGGDFVNNGIWPDWMYWDRYRFDMSGTQDRESRHFVDLLSQMIGVAVVPVRD